MGKYARGKHAVLIDDRSGFKIKYKDARTEWTGFRVYKGDWEPKQPQLDPGMYIEGGDPSVLRNPRPPQSTSDTIVQLGSLYGKWSGQMGTALGARGIKHPSGENAVGMQMNTTLNSLGLSIAVVLPIPSAAYQIATSTLNSAGIVINVDEDATLPAMTSTLNSTGVTVAVVAPVTLSAMASTLGTVSTNHAEDASLPVMATTLGAITLNSTEIIVASTLGAMTAVEGSTGLFFNTTEIPPGLASTSQLGTVAINVPGWGTGAWGQDLWGQ
tara:strand:+ start:1249 stop:2061 length:813 start_codon:yes stop_codon:yes gene_type:complete